MIFICLFAISTVSANEMMNETDSLMIDESNDLEIDENNDFLSYGIEDNLSSTQSNTGTFSSLSYDIKQAGYGNTITLTKDYVYSKDVDHDLYYKGISISKPITIDGNGHTINGDSSSCIFNIKGDHVFLKNMYIINGRGLEEDKGAVMWSGTNGICKNVNFKSNSGISFGALYYNGKNGTILNCTFIDNFATSKSGGALKLIEPTINIKDCYFINNSALKQNNGYGGAIVLSTSCCANIINCTFINNTAYEGGGAIYIGTQNNNISSCLFIDNKVINNERKGAIYAVTNYNTVRNSVFLHNTGNFSGVLCDTYNTYTSESYSKTNDEKSNISSDINQTFYPLVEYISCNEYDDWFTPYALANISYWENKYNFTSFTFIQDKNDYVIGVKILEDFVGSINLIKYESSLYGMSKYLKTVRELNFSSEGTEIMFHANNLDLGTYRIEVTKLIGYDKNGYAINYSLGNVEFEVSRNININTSDVKKYVGGNERFTALITNNKSKPISGAYVSIIINDVEYTKYTDNNGQVSLGLNLDGGYYDVKTKCSSVSKISHIIILKTITANDINKIYKNGTQYYATFKDSQGNLLKNTDVKFNINGVFYTRTTNNQGTAKMNINLNPGTYILTAENPINGEKHSNKITVLPNIAENHDLTKYYRNNSQYRVRLLDDNGKPVGAGVDVTFNINGVFYTRTTNAEGYAKMNIILGEGTYINTADYKGLKSSKTIKV